MTLVNQGGLGKLTTLFLRGAESDHVLVLVDGVRVGSATSGLVALQDLPLAEIERVDAREHLHPVAEAGHLQPGDKIHKRQQKHFLFFLINL